VLSRGGWRFGQNPLDGWTGSGDLDGLALRDAARNAIQIAGSRPTVQRILPKPPTAAR